MDTFGLIHGPHAYESFCIANIHCRFFNILLQEYTKVQLPFLKKD